jgi:hypothetical protein
VPRPTASNQLTATTIRKPSKSRAAGSGTFKLGTASAKDAKAAREGLLREAKKLHASIERISIGRLELPVMQTQIGMARSELTNLIRAATTRGYTYLIQSGKSPGQPAVVLASVETLDRLYRRARPRRTLGELVRALPFSVEGVQLRAGIPNDAVRGLRVPELAP